jgi:superfamily II DNA or RNA helicase
MSAVGHIRKGDGFTYAPLKRRKTLSGTAVETRQDWVHCVLRKDQQHALAWLLRSSSMFKFAVLAADMGFGKTVVTITALVERYFAMAAKRPSIVVASLSVSKVWKEQTQTHCAPHVQDKIVFVEPRTLEGAGRINNSTWLVVVTYESLQSKRPGLQLITQQPYSTLVLDEGHNLRNLDTKRAASVRLLARRETWVMSGTPLQNKVEDIASLLVLGGVMRLKGKPTATLVRNFMFENQEKFFNMLRCCFLRIRRIEGFDCKMIEYSRHEPFDPDEQELYDLELQKEIKDEHGVKKSKQGMFQRVLHRCARSPVKLRMIGDLIQNYTDPETGALKRRMIIFSGSIAMQKNIQEFCQSLGFSTGLICGKHTTDEREQILAEFFQNQYDIVVLSFKSCNEGINAQCASVVVFADMAWPAPMPFEQAKKRAFRPGQTEKEVHVYMLSISGTLESHIEHIHKAKLAKSEAICNAMPTLDDFREDGTAIEDPERKRDAHIEFDTALRLEMEKAKHTAHGISLSSGRDIKRILPELKKGKDSAFMRSMVASYRIDESHNGYLFGRESYAADKQDADKVEQQQRDARDRTVLEMCENINDIHMLEKTSWYARLAQHQDVPGLFDTWLQSPQGAYGLLSFDPINKPYARIKSKKAFRVLLINNQAFGKIMDEQCVDYQQIYNVLHFVRNKIRAHIEQFPDANPLIHQTAAALNDPSVFAVGAETRLGDLYLPLATSEVGLAFFDRSTVEFQAKEETIDLDDDFWDDMF